MLTWRSLITGSILALIGALFAGQPTSAQRQTPPANGPTDPRELEAFVDPIITEQMAKAHIPGAVFLAVKDGAVLFQKGYGFADLEKKRPVVPDQTVFRVFSLSKLLTATAIMQLAEEGRLNLNEDVNKYLKHFQISDPFPEPVTIASLLTHTAGFDEDQLSLGAAARDERDMQPMEAYLASHLPSPLWPPGQQYLYSNAAFTVLGEVVEELSGRPFAQYIEEQILKPLDMNRSSFAQPPPAAADVAVSYQYSGGTYRPLPVSYFNNPPGRALTATAEDMAHFMIAHLQDGRYEGARILQEATAQEMHRQHFTYRTGEPGMAYGFREVDWYTGGLLHYGGGPNSPSSAMLLLPAQHLGYFLAYNSDDDFALAGALSDKFLRHYYPADPLPVRQPPSDFAARASEFTGTYRYTDYAHRSIAKLTTLLWDDYPQVIEEGGTLAIRWSGNPGKPSPIVEIAPLLFAAKDDSYHIVFREDANHRVSQMTFAVTTFDKVAWYQTSAFQKAALAFFGLLFLAATASTVAAYVRRRARHELAETGMADRLLWFVPGVVGFLNLFFLVALAWTLQNAFDPSLGLQFGAPPWLYALLIIPMLTVGLTVVEVILLVMTWRRSESFRGRALFAFFSFGSTLFIPFLQYWNLLGFNF